MHEIDTLSAQYTIPSESPVSTFEKFIRTGIKSLTQPDLQRDHLLSTFKETHRLKDEYTYFCDNKGLYWLTDKLEKIYIQDVTSRPTNVRSKEGYVLDQLEMWAKYADEGFSIWFSPDKNSSGGYPCSKVIFHKISYEISERFSEPQKAVAICSINIDVPAHLIAQKLADIFGRDDIRDLEKLREVLLVPDGQQMTEVINIIQSINSNLLDPKFGMSEIKLREKTIYIRDQINLGVDPYIVALEARQQGILGNYSISCAEGGIASLINNKLNEQNPIILEGTYAKNCGMCGAVIESYITPGYVCKSCGEMYKGVC